MNTTDNNAFESGVDKSDTATVATYTPAFQSITVVNERERSNFDLDEFSDSDDFSIKVSDQRGNGFEDADRVPEYRYVITPADGSAATTTNYVPATSNGDGTYDVSSPKNGVAGAPATLPAGSYTLQVRRPAFQGSGFAQADPITVTAAESEIKFTDGAEANAPVNGEYTVTGKLALTSAGGASLANRRVELTYAPGADSSFAPQAQQPSGTRVLRRTRPPRSPTPTATSRWSSPTPTCPATSPRPRRPARHGDGLRGEGRHHRP